MQFPTRFRWILPFLVLAYASVGTVKPAEAQAREEAMPEIAPLFRNLFRAMGVPDVRSDEERSSDEKDPIDSRIPKDPQIDAIWKASQEAVQQKDWKQSLDLIQRLLDYPEDAVVELERGRWESVRVRANRLLGELPTSVRDDYERRYGGLSRQLLTQYAERPNPEKLVEIASRYFYTDAGAEAAALLARWHFDQQEFLLASHWNRDLWERGWKGTQEPGWRLQAAFAARQAGLTSFPDFAGGLLKSQPPATMIIGGKPQSVSTWWNTTHLPQDELPKPSNWLEFGGSSARLSQSEAGDPLLLPLWSQPLTFVPSVREKVASIIRDLRDHSTPTIPAASPVIVGNRIAFRDLHSVRVVDLETGRSVWQTEEGVSPERILNGIPAHLMDRGNAWRMRVNAQQFDHDFQGGAADLHPLTSWLYRDGTTGFLSCDSERLYVLEDLAVMTRNQSGYGNQAEGDVFDQFGASWNSNRLSAYDLATGRLEWTVGGPKTTETQSLPLAGHFFFGVPAIEYGELYVVGTSGQEIRLNALDPRTGTPRWSQLLAYSDTKIELDVARRWLGAPVAVRDGLIICPTTVGWVVAVDRTRRCLLWGHRYLPRAEPGEMDPASQFLIQRSLFDSWAVGAPIITGNEVLIAPADSDKLFCLNLLDGKATWSCDRDTGLYPIVTDADHVVIVGSEGIQCRQLSTGEIVWSQTWAKGIYPTGRGALLDRELAIPFSDGSVLILDITKGETVRSLQVAEGQTPLGSLIKVGDRFVSLGADGCRCFIEKEKFLEQLARTNGADEENWNSRIQAAEYDLLHSQPENAIRMLTDAEAARWPAELQERRRLALWSAWMAMMKRDSANIETAMRELALLVRTSDEKFRIETLKIEQKLAAADIAGAVKLLRQMATGSDESVMVSRPDQPYVRVQRQLWIAGELQSLWDSGTPQTRSILSAEIEPLISAALRAPLEEQIRLSTWCGFHPRWVELQWTIADGLARAGQFSRAEATLAYLQNSEDPTVAAEARLRLSRLYHQFHLIEEAARIAAAMLQEKPQQTLASSETVAERIAAWQLLTETSKPISALRALARYRPLVAQRSAASYLPQQQELLPPLDNYYFSQRTMQIEPQEQRLTIQSRPSGEWEWMAPLRSVPQAQHSGYYSYKFLGHRIVVLHRDVLQVISPVQQEFDWAVSATDERNPMIDYGHRPTTQPMIDTASLDNESVFWTFRSTNQGPLAICHDRAIAVTGRRTVTVFDPRSGRVRWKHENLPGESYVVGTHDLLLVLDSDCVPTAYRLMDGRQVKLPEDMRDSFCQVVATTGNNVILLDRKPGIRLFNITTGSSSLRCQNLQTGEIRWQMTLKPGARMTRLDEEHLLVAGSSPRSAGGAGHSLEQIHLVSGKVRKFEGLSAFRGEQGFTAVRDRERLYVVVNHGFSGSYSYGDSLPSTRVHGTMITWDLESGEKLWERKVNNQNLALDRFEESPLLLFLARNWKQVGSATYTTLHLLVVDKETGTVLHDSTSPSLFSGFHGLRVDDARSEIELLSYNQRLRLGPAPQNKTSQGEEVVAEKEGVEKQ